MKTDCPVRGTEYDCRVCEFYDTYGDEGKQACRSKVTNMMLNDVGNMLKLLLDSSEHNRETSLQLAKSVVEGGPTEDLLKLTGSKHAPH